MNILLLGSGGREDALAWRLRQSPSCDALIAAPGNPGIARWAKCVAIDPCDPAAVVALAEREKCDFVTADDKLVNALQPQFSFIKHLSTLP